MLAVKKIELFWNSLNQVYFDMFDPIETILIKFEQFWSSLDKFGSLWTSFMKFVSVWTHLDYCNGAINSRGHYLKLLF